MAVEMCMVPNDPLFVSKWKIVTLLWSNLAVSKLTIRSSRPADANAGRRVAVGRARHLSGIELPTLPPSFRGRREQGDTLREEADTPTQRSLRWISVDFQKVSPGKKGQRILFLL